MLKERRLCEMILKNNVVMPEADVDELSLDNQSQILEAAMIDNLSQEEILEFSQDHQEVFENVRGEILTEKSIVRFDKAAKLSRAKEIALYQIAKEKKNPLFGKLVTAWRVERYIKAKFNKIYGIEATRRARKALAAAAKKPTKTMKKVIDRVAMRAKRDINALKDTHAKQIVAKLNTK
jgi:hypothetical protein